MKSTCLSNSTLAALRIRAFQWNDVFGQPTVPQEQHHLHFYHQLGRIHSCCFTATSHGLHEHQTFIGHAVLHPFRPHRCGGMTPRKIPWYPKLNLTIAHTGRSSMTDLWLLSRCLSAYTSPRRSLRSLPQPTNFSIKASLERHIKYHPKSSFRALNNLVSSVMVVEILQSPQKSPDYHSVHKSDPSLGMVHWVDPACKTLSGCHQRSKSCHPWQRALAV